MQSTGKVLEPNDTVGDSLKIYGHEEAGANIMKFKCKKQIQEIQENANLTFPTFQPTETLKDLLCPELKKSRFVTFKEKFSENMFFKKPELGRGLSVGSKPIHNEDFIYGIKTAQSERAYDLILPKKSAEEVNREYINWHSKYIISHNHYLPSERIVRNYNDKFNSNSTFGVCNNVDKTGKMVKKCLQECDHLAVIKKGQKSFLDRTVGQMGQRINRYDLNLDTMKTYGIITNRPDCDVRALVEGIESCPKKSKLIEAIYHINKLRSTLFKRNDFNMYDLKLLLQKYDEGNTGYITCKSAFKALRSLLIYASEEKIRTAALHYKIVADDSMESINLDKFWKMLHMQYPLPSKFEPSAMTHSVHNHNTNYRLMCNDRDKPLVDGKFVKPVQKFTDADRTGAGDVISPNIPMYFGLVPSDFEILRTKQDLKKIFQHILTDNFDTIWELARSELNGDINCKMSVNNLRIAMNSCNNRKNHNYV